ncbi:MAG: dockerin type I domain-containing protein, partial [Chloroflexota bacterium]|nr:dockerin type I domain-containing protein [Chloroflexota bacterium]
QLTLSGTFDVAQAGATLNISADLPNSFTTTVTKKGLGILNLSSAMTSFGGGLDVEAGRVNVLPGASFGPPLHFYLQVNNANTGAGTAVTLDLRTSVNVAYLSGSVAQASTGTNTASVNLEGASTVLALSTGSSGAGTYAGAITGTGSVVFSSRSTAGAFNGNNSYAGTTSVSQGTLLINGVSSGQGNYLVSGGSSIALAALGGTGTIGLANNSTMTFGQFSQLQPGPQNAIGTLTVQGSGSSGVIFGDGSAYVADIGPAGASDRLVINGGSINLTSSSDTLTLNALAGAFDGSNYTIATFDQNVGGGTFNNVQGLPAGYSVQYNPTSIRLVVPQQPLQLVAAASRKTHGTAGTFDLDLLAGNAVEPRNSGGTLTLVFTFTNYMVSGNAVVTAGTGTVSGSPTFSGRTMTVNLTGVADVQRLGVTLQNATDQFSQTLPDTTFTVALLTGDTNGDTFVNAGDALQTRTRAGAITDATNFRNDINADGFINSGDIQLVRSHSGNALP